MDGSQHTFNVFSFFRLDYVELPSAVQRVEDDDCEEGKSCCTVYEIKVISEK